MKREDTWAPDFFQGAPLFDQIQMPCRFFTMHVTWPDLSDYQSLLHSRVGVVNSGSGARLRFVPQSEKAYSWVDAYEPRIYLHGEIQTRLSNWHDFFQAIIWSTYPRAKIALNDLHFHQIQDRLGKKQVHGTRSPVENALTIFDECGAILAVRNCSIQDLIKSFRWKELFWAQRNLLIENMKCFIFGHALYEKALQPYIGMTAHAIILEVEDAFFTMNEETQQREIDRELAKLLYQAGIRSPGDLNPFPLLGMPGWWDNDQASFYDNVSYFRPGRRNQPA